MCNRALAALASRLNSARARSHMLVEGGYLHSMKLLIEKAARTADPTPDAHLGIDVLAGNDRRVPARGTVGRSLRKVIVILFRDSDE